ncbi:glucose-6-phosphate dehydrogenase [Sorangium sp. So ce1000]|uniref:glucose-6-phosphate dehydrogenase n=1 Tax=Sorangium sp. So ce1000 TaxID=3133325 RepID=UPI003F5DF569
MTQAEKNPLREGMPEERTASPAALVIFGASGDLTRRKLLPAVYNLSLSRLLTGGFAVVGVARRPKPDFAKEMREAVAKYSRRPLEEASWSELEKGISYVQGSFDEAETYTRLAAELERLDAERGTRKNRVFYLAVGPDQFAPIVRGLRAANLVAPPSHEKGAPFQHVVVEKPFGEDLESARALNRDLLAHLAESQIYRIDHYLGKETVQNLLVLRFGNTIFEPLWSRQHVDHVQITVAEEIGVEGRGKFYEKVGITRDIVQNHALQLLTLVAMEPPSSWGADAVRDEKVKVLRTLRPIAGPDVLSSTVRGQYAPGMVRGEKVPGYTEEPDVAKDSTTETYVAMKLHLDSWRWGGVPFYLRAGKRLAKRVAEVVLHFKPLPHGLFKGAPGATEEPNALVMRLQPDEGISLRFAAKIPGSGIAIRGVTMDFRYGAAFGSSTPEAYERLLLDALRGDATLFTRADEVEAQWGFVDPIFEGWRTQRAPIARYAAGSWGPPEADALVEPSSEDVRAVCGAGDGGKAPERAWRRP